MFEDKLIIHEKQVSRRMKIRWPVSIVDAPVPSTVHVTKIQVGEIEFEAKRLVQACWQRPFPNLNQSPNSKPPEDSHQRHLQVQGMSGFSGLSDPQITRMPVSNISFTNGLFGVKSLGLKGKTSKSVLTEIVILRILFLSMKRMPSNS